MTINIMDDRILITEDLTSEDLEVIKTYPDLKVYSLVYLDSVNIEQQLKRPILYEDTNKLERIDTEDTNVTIINSYIAPMQVISTDELIVIPVEDPVEDEIPVSVEEQTTEPSIGDQE